MFTRDLARAHKRITQADIAERLGISRATVSAALSGQRYVSPELKAQILALVEDLHYVPDIVARSMKTNRTLTIGLVMPNILSPIWATIARAVADVARKAGFSTIVYDTDEQCHVMTAALRTLHERRVDGIVLAPCSGSEDASRELLERMTIPVVLVDRYLSDLRMDMVVSNGHEGTYQAVSHLIETGRRRIGLINLPLDISTGRERLEGYGQALTEHDIQVDPRLIMTGGRGAQEGERQAKQLLSLPPALRPDSVLAASHLMTVGTLAALRSCGLRAPDDIAVIGFDDTAWAPLLDPPLTVVNQPAYTMGAKAADILLARLEGSSTIGDEPLRVVLPSMLIHRYSCCSTPYRL
jgi:DNA-binding LacI/PurR family transcriptional regulator